MDEDEKVEEINKINSGLQGITKNKPIFNETKNNGMLRATVNNVVFVNFHKDFKFNFEKFGTEDLFNKIYEFFIQSKDYIEFSEELNPQIIEKKQINIELKAVIYYYLIKFGQESLVFFLE